MGAVCSESPQIPGPSVITSTSRRSDDAPPEGRPSRVKQLQAKNVDDTMFDEDGGSEADTSTSAANKCKGKYRIKVKGAACHGRACCRGT